MISLQNGRKQQPLESPSVTPTTLSVVTPTTLQADSPRNPEAVTPKTHPTRPKSLFFASTFENITDTPAEEKKIVYTAANLKIDTPQGFLVKVIL